MNFDHLYKFKTIESTLKEYEIKEKTKKNSSELSRLLNSIRSNSIWYADPSTLNDPFEFQYYHNSKSNFDSVEAKKNACELVGVFSMTPVIENPVLWTMYGDRFQGVAFRINPKAFSGLVKVKYRKDAYKIPNKTKKDKYQIFQEIFASKSSYWSYEHEVRHLIYEQGLLVLDLKEAINELIIGNYMDTKIKKFLAYNIEAINKTRKNPVAITEAVPASRGYKINFVPYNL